MNDDHLSPGVAEDDFGRPRIRFAHVLQGLMDERYKRNRAALAQAAHVSPSALSQYARGRATPTLAVLADLAQALEVSLDYLVFGQSPPESVEYTAWAQHLQDTVRVMTSEAASLRQLVDRIGLEIADRLQETATEVVRKSGATGGALTALEIAQLESYSYRTQIATVDLDTDILLPRENLPDSAAAPGPFAEVIARNILEGGAYEYIVPDDVRSVRRARLIHREITDKLRGQLDQKAAAAAIHGRLLFYATSEGLVPSYVIYQLNRGRLSREKPLLFDLIEGFLASDGENVAAQDCDMLALVEPPNPGFDVYPLIARGSLPTVAASFQNLRNHSDRLSFTGQGDPTER